ncbi:MAG: alanine racemase [Treponemataceae bacterium]|nr:MAG: alanine racemase [Treponemataceae bacterium]
MRATQAKIYLANLTHNINEIQKLLGADTKLCLPVKADGYGHGAAECAKAAYENGVRFFGVATAEEGESIRHAFCSCSKTEKTEDAHLLLFSPFLPDDIESIVKNEISPFVFEPDIIGLLDKESARQGKVTKVHLKIDTGMSRCGCAPEDALEIARFIGTKKNIVLHGTCTHFAVADSFAKNDIEFTQLQFERFLAALEGIRKAGIDTGIRHCANSGATLLHPEMHLDMVRPGIASYGCFPFDFSIDSSIDSPIAKKMPHLLPVMELVTKITVIKTIEKNSFVSYGKTWQAQKACKIGILPIGYADGLLRSYAKALQVSVGGKTFPVIGRICMDQCMILLDENSAGVKAGDEVIIFGQNGKTTAGHIAQNAHTIPYEVTCGISKRVRRIFVS